ncbi:5' nucleotidase, NT5C type [Aureitalea marina]|uniref:5'(3')-deoxyribonucleotidase n=1 Tax=Aureitalea marina TaxID=930804 RepID=A0A2S7KP54_9FLAO|nr:5'(3')-deoxyribonucleotidase [Aureitalea marina]PQB04401.1 5'(3')-deoxyribonucleotidase [Aureitalea marina]
MIIFVDMDEVIADSYGHFIRLYNQEFNASLQMKNIHFGEAWQNVPEEHQSRVKEYHWEPGFFSDLDPLPGSQEVLEEIATIHDVYIATAATQFPNSLREKSDWLDHYFPFIHWRNRILCGDKSILKGDVLIDDRSYNLESFEGRSIMFASPHNNGSNSYEKVSSWYQLKDLFLK